MQFRMLGIGLALLLLPVNANAQPEVPKYYAVLVGVEKYQHPKLREPEPLKYSIEDVTDLATILGQQGYEVSMLTDDQGKTKPELSPTRENILREIKSTLRKCRERDTVIVALAGHGLQFTGQRDSYFCPMDARPFADETTTLVSISDIYLELEKSFAGVKVVLVDACRNDPDPARGRGIEDEFGPLPPKGVAALFSCSTGQRAFENDDLKHGVFFHYLLQGMRGAVKDIDGGVSFDRLQLYVRDKVTQWAQDNPRFTSGRGQTPNLKADLSGKPIQLFPKGFADGSARYGEELWEKIVAKLRKQVAETPDPMMNVWILLIETHFLKKPLPHRECVNLIQTYQNTQSGVDEKTKLLTLAAFEAFWVLAPNVELTPEDRHIVLDRLESTGDENLKRFRLALMNNTVAHSYWQSLVKFQLLRSKQATIHDEAARLINPLILDMHRTVPTKDEFENLFLDMASPKEILAMICEPFELPLELGDINDLAKRRELYADIFPANWRTVRRSFQKMINDRLLRTKGYTADVLLREVAAVEADQRDVKLRGAPTVVMVCICGGLCSTSKKSYDILAELQQKEANKFNVVVFGDSENKEKAANVFAEKKLTARFAPYNKSLEVDVSAYGPIFIGVDADGRVVSSFASLRNADSLNRLVDSMMKHHNEQNPK